MPEITFAAARPRADLIAAVCRRSGCIDRSLRVVAEGLLGAGSTIDVVAVDGEGRIVLVLAGEEGRDLELFTRAIAQRAWVAPRVRDWVQLAPSLGLEPNADVRLVLLSPSYQPETIAAAEAIGRDFVSLSTYRWVANGSAESVLIEPAGAPQGAPLPVEPPAPGAAPAHPPAAASPPELEPRPAENAAPAGGSGTRFRTGLTAEDLNLTPQEAREFE